MFNQIYFIVLDLDDEELRPSELPKLVLLLNEFRLKLFLKLEDILVTFFFILSNLSYSNFKLTNINIYIYRWIDSWSQLLCVRN